MAPGYAIWGALNAVYLSIETTYNWPARLSRTWPGRVTAVLATVTLWAFSQIYYYDTHSKLAPEDVNLHEKILNIIRSRSSVSKKQAAARKILETFCENSLQYFPRKAEQVKPPLASRRSA